MYMKKLSVIACLMLALMSVNAQHVVNPFFDEMGIPRIQTVEYSQAPDTIVTTFHRMDDVMWSRTVYRVVDLRYKQNYQLYFPQKANDPDYKNLLLVILEALADGVPAFEMTDNDPTAPIFKPDWRTPVRPQDMTNRLIELSVKEMDQSDIEAYEIAEQNAKVLQYDEANDKYNLNLKPFEAITKNQIKYLVQEMVFFDRHTSRMHRSILAIAPLRADMIKTTFDPEEELTNEEKCQKIQQALTESFTCWIPFLALRPYLVMQYAIPIQNETKRVTFDEFFQKRLFTSYLLGEDNMYNRMITEYASDAETIRKEQDRIENEMLNFEQDLWEY